jgi:probable HAF family extracellular repeat protein
MVALAHLLYSADAISDDGSTIVGLGFQNGQGVVRWTEAEGAVWIGHLPGLSGTVYSFSSDVSADGSVIVGGSGEDANFRAFLWTNQTGMKTVQQLLSQSGVDLMGWTLQYVSSISADGRSMTGVGLNPDGHSEGWVAVLQIPEPSASFIIILSLIGGIFWRDRVNSTNHAAAPKCTAALCPTRMPWASLSG